MLATKDIVPNKEMLCFRPSLMVMINHIVTAGSNKKTPKFLMITEWVFHVPAIVPCSKVDFLLLNSVVSCEEFLG